MSSSTLINQVQIIKSKLLKSNQYYNVKTTKKKIFLHDTAGASASSSINWWNEKPDHIAAPYLIERDGTIIEAFDPSYWAYALGVPGGTDMEKESIHIELCNYGGLSEMGGKYYIFGNKLNEIPIEKVQLYKVSHRGFKAFEKYTAAQIKSTILLIDYLCKTFKIKISDVENFWYFGAKSKGLHSHTTVRKDKSDIHPQPELIKAIYDYAGCKAAITE